MNRERWYCADLPRRGKQIDSPFTRHPYAPLSLSFHSCGKSRLSECLAHESEIDLYDSFANRFESPFKMDVLKMKEALAFIGILALAVSLWFIKERSDKKIIDSKNEAIKSLQDTVQAKADLIAKDNDLLDLKNEMIKSLQSTIQLKEDIIVKNNALLDSGNLVIKSLNDIIQTKEGLIDRNNAIISAYQEQLAGLTKKDAGDKDDDSLKVYPEDNGFEAQDLGSGFNAYQVFGPVNNPANVKIPSKIPNHTPWKFGGGNSGIAANGSGFYLTGAANLDSNGATSTSGQAGYLEFNGSSISQSTTLPTGTYSVTFDYEGRRDYAPANQIAVSIDKTVLFTGAPTDCNNFKRVTTDSIFLAKSGHHELLFRGLGAMGDISGDHTTFIDNISFNLIGTRITNPNKDNNNFIIESTHQVGDATNIQSELPANKDALKK